MKPAILKKTIISTFLLFVFEFVAYAQAPPVRIKNGLDSLFAEHVNQTLGFVPGHVIRIEKPGFWVYEKGAGVSVLHSNDSVSPEMKFKIASVTKMFTTVCIFKLIQAGSLKMDDTIGKFLPPSVVQNYDNHHQITIRRLLSHTSGICEPQSYFQGRLNFWIYMKRFEDISVDSLLLWSYAAGNGFGNYNYSNANFYVLAEIIKSISGKTCQQLITDSIIVPLGLLNTDFNRIPTGSFMRGYLQGAFYPQGGVPNGLDPDSTYDFTEASNSWGYGAADFWSNTPDLITFHKALFSGQLIGQNWLDTMSTVVSNTGDMGAYCYGLMRFKSYNNGPFYGYGHTGSAFGYGDMLTYIPELDVYVCSAGNYMKIGQEFLHRDIYTFLKNNINSIDEHETGTEISLYPNPVSNMLFINGLKQDITLSVIDVNGRALIQQSEVRKIDVSHLSGGIYFIHIMTKEGKNIFTGKFIKQTNQ